VHRHGGKIFAQLSHAGSQSVAIGTRPIAPSDVPNMMTGREVPAATCGEIEATVEAFGAAARRAVAAGFDGVHLHGANGYLISQFSSPLTNRREDGWGGSSKGRDRFAIEVTRRIRAELPPTHALSVKLGCIDIMEGGLGLDESIRRAKLLVAAGANAFEVSCNLMTSYADNIVPYVALTRRRALADLLPHRLLHAPAPEAYYRWIAQALRPAVQVPLVLGGGIRSVSTMADIVDSGDADFIALARPFIREPALARVRANRPAVTFRQRPSACPTRDSRLRQRLSGVANRPGRRHCGYSSFRQLRGSAGCAFGVRSSRKLK
jgi:2,4-dienoyl-CoA reductase-like NADH-dependent reductase (Old Yellow Enzyme family)